MRKIGITGQSGFVGQHLYNQLYLNPDEFSIIPFEKAFFDSESQLKEWASKCDVIVHLAALNRHHSPEVIYDTNLVLVNKLIHALDGSLSLPHVLFTSSTQENNGTIYGQSKLEGRERLKQWGEEKGATVTGLIVPNVFGPFGKPFYNSVIGTFSHLLCNGGSPKIDKDNKLRLIYVGELVTEIISIIRHKVNCPAYIVNHTAEYSVSEILAKLESYKEDYFDQGNIPSLTDSFSINLFNTFRSYIDQRNYFPAKLRQNADDRGSFTEMIRLSQGGQVSFSTTKENITRGNHFHTRKIERFIVIKGKALIQLRKFNTTEVIDIELSGDQPSYVDMPIWYIHNIKNIGEGELYTVFWINEFYDPKDADTYFQIV